MPSINNRVNVAAFMERVKAAASAAMEGVGEEADEALHDLLGTPYPPASQIGEAPHRRTGALQEGVQSIVTEDDQSVEYQQASTREGGDPKVPQYLEASGRPFISAIRDEYGQKFKDATVDALRKEFND